MRRLRSETFRSRFTQRRLQLRLALLYSGIFLVSGVVLLAIAIVPIGSTTPVGAGSHGRTIASAQHGADVQQLVIGSVVALAVLIPLSLVLGWLIAGRFLRPLHTITTTARDISVSDLHRRLVLDERDDELRELGATLNDLFTRLEASFESQRHFVANASHELRTPLTAERVMLQVALADPNANAETLRATCEQVLMLGSQQERLIEGLLVLASSEQGVVQWEPVDLADVAERVLFVRRQEAERRGVRVDTDLGSAPMVGDHRLVESLVANLVENALRHNVVGGRVGIATRIAAGRASISIRNTGAAIPGDEVDRLFKPFQRLGNERIGNTDGHGLGLAIVRAIAEAHGAALRALPRPEGGLDVEVTFPVDKAQLPGNTVETRVGASADY